MDFGQSMTELKNRVITDIVNNQEIVKAMVITEQDFLNAIPTSVQQTILDAPLTLIRKQVMPYTKVTSKTNQSETYITSAWTDFRKNGNMISGTVRFFILVNVAYEKTNFGIRYDFIADKIEEVLHKNNIGEFQFYDRGDITVTTNEMIGNTIAFKLTDFHITGSDLHG